MNLDDVIRLWYKTQIGNIHECKKNQLIFHNIMWTLYGNLEKDENLDLPKHQSLGDEPI